MEDISSDCQQCGECCGTLLEGVGVTQDEWEAIEEYIDMLCLDSKTIQQSKASLRLPTIDVGDLKRCVFLKTDNLCEIYDKKPVECKRFPIWVTESRVAVTFVVSYICPRAEVLATTLKQDLPVWAKELLNDRHYRVVLI